jgi:phosphatidate cytidylyltransferase
VASAAVLAPLALWVTWLGQPVFHLVVALAAVLMHAEWLRLSETQGLKALEWIRIVVLIVALALGTSGNWIFGVLLLLILAVVSSAIGHPRDGIRIWPAIGTLYIGVPCLSLLWLRDRHGFEIVIALFAVVWATDVGAYVAGRLIGGPKLAPKISPRKTWSGSVGGLVAAAAAGLAVAMLTDKVGVLPALGLSLGVSLAAEVGDLAESMLKRHFDVKDSGSLIPGHGGLLDRLDSMLIAAPVLALLQLVL